MQIQRLIPILALLLISAPAWSGERPRSAAAKAEFKRTNPCPSTGSPRGLCPGHVIDHVTPLCAGGEDAPRNMQWQTVEAAKIKDRREREQCALRAR